MHIKMKNKHNLNLGFFCLMISHANQHMWVCKMFMWICIMTLWTCIMVMWILQNGLTISMYWHLPKLGMVDTMGTFPFALWNNWKEAKISPKNSILNHKKMFFVFFFLLFHDVHPSEDFNIPFKILKPQYMVNLGLLGFKKYSCDFFFSLFFIVFFQYISFFFFSKVHNSSLISKKNSILFLNLL